MKAHGVGSKTVQRIKAELTDEARGRALTSNGTRD